MADGYGLDFLLDVVSPTLWTSSTKPLSWFSAWFDHDGSE